MVPLSKQVFQIQKCMDEDTCSYSEQFMDEDMCSYSQVYGGKHSFDKRQNNPVGLR